MDSHSNLESAQLGVCSWSLQPASPADLAYKVSECGLHAVQLALDPIRLDPSTWPLRETWKKIDGAGISVLSGMMAMRGEDYSTLESIRRTGGVRPDEHWEANLAAARDNAEIAHQFGIEMVSFHAGFIPHDPNDPERIKVVDRILELADVFAEREITIALETGQESAQTLISVLDELDHPMIGVNFDPANMILYGMGDPVKALRDLALFIDQVHLKDAAPASELGRWGTETVLGTGAVDWGAFFQTVADEELSCNFLIEREAGSQRIADVTSAARFVSEFGLRSRAE
ncbi:MAG: sugar phosphate isomerase/epimerase family protein [Phycisphaerales bacterium]